MAFGSLGLEEELIFVSLFLYHLIWFDYFGLYKWLSPCTMFLIQKILEN